MERPDVQIGRIELLPEFISGKGEQGQKTIFQLTRGFIGEGGKEEPAGIDFLEDDEIESPPEEHPRFSGTGPAGR